MKAGDWLVSPQLFGAFPSSPITTTSMPTIQSSYLALSSPQQYSAEHALSTRVFNPHHHTFSHHRQGYEPYPTAEEVFLRSNTSEPDEDFGNLYLADMITANKRVGQHCLVQYRDNFQEDLWVFLIAVYRWIWM